MERLCFTFQIRPGTEAEYKKRHDEIWPELSQDIRNAGMLNYSIFRYGLTLFGYFEAEDLDATLATLLKSDANRRWGEYMAPIMKSEIDTSRNFPFLLPLQWHQD